MAGSLIDLLTEEMINLNIEAKDWREALLHGGQLLVDSGGTEPRYLDAMIKMVNEMGPYVVIAPGLALGHAGPDKGVNHTCFSLITLKTPVEFGMPENDPVDVIFSFAAPNKEDHMEALRGLAMFCMEKENLGKVRAAQEVKEVRKLLINFFTK